ncbi:hypothetical protein [Streptomyces sp. NPDC017964]|uniref:hypothetical protein n=1 Tax=Streptomyces sp. NPDC017964 TaxID=3365022 RepID=UPI0037B64DDA
MRKPVDSGAPEAAPGLPRPGGSADALALRCRTAVLSAVLILSPAGCGPDASDSGKASRTRASPTPASPSAGLPEGDSWRSAYVSESGDAETRDVAAASAIEDWAIGRDRIHVSTAIEKASGYSTFFLHYGGKKWRNYDAAADLPKLATLGLTVLEASGPDNVWLALGGLLPAGQNRARSQRPTVSSDCCFTKSSGYRTPNRSGVLGTSGRAGPTRGTSTTAWW